MAIINQTITKRYALYNGDCCEAAKSFPDDSMDMMLFSPPFADLYCYSDSPNDMGNCTSYEDFFEHFGYLIGELLRILKPGRLCAVHCMEIPSHKSFDGVIGIKDFPGDIIRHFVSAGFIYHSRHVIWTDPLIAATRTKALGLMHKQLMKDSTMCRAGLQTYLVTFRKPGENQKPVAHPEGLTKYCGSDNPSEGETGIKKSHHIWRAYASPVWMDIRQTHVLNVRAAREADDEKHVCPLQLDVIERACVLWSNPGEVVFTPFMGVGSEVYGAVLNGRKGVGIELKTAYYNQAVRNLAEVESAREQELIAV